MTIRNNFQVRRYFTQVLGYIRNLTYHKSQIHIYIVYWVAIKRLTAFALSVDRIRYFLKDSRQEMQVILMILKMYEMIGSKMVYTKKSFHAQEITIIS